jgi:hypothetical protein
MDFIKRIPGWVLDLVIALVLAGIAVALERLTQGRIGSPEVFSVVGGSSFLLLRGGAVLAKAGRTLGCLYGFVITWILPCAVVIYFIANPDYLNIIRDSTPFFVYLGFVVIAIMGITFERVRQEDERRFAAAAQKQPPTP